MSDSWRVTLPCTKAEAELLKGDIIAFALLDAPPVLMTSEPDPARPDEWRLDAYFEAKPAKADLALLTGLVPSARSVKPVVERIADEDWVTLSQAGLEPIRAGRFFVHTPAHRGEVPPDGIAFEIDAGRAFGTGHHETTAGCLAALDRLKRGGANFQNTADIGTGTGLLAYAALRLWPAARAIASDIDPVAIEVAADNARVNHIPIGRARGQVELAVAPGMRHSRLLARAPYDLLIANILAGPLIELAPDLAGAVAPGGRLILAGLLKEQAPRVAAAYRRRRMMPVARIDNGDWAILTMRKRQGA
ncbi:MAG: 50S ribosomal protein L11 methyltransferase [Sphingomonas sp.]|nr:50S ribosomal protein L11 methyltransferase [Sphingomonas sp.]